MSYDHDIFGIKGEQDERIHILVAHFFLIDLAFMFNSIIVFVIVLIIS